MVPWLNLPPVGSLKDITLEDLRVAWRRVKIDLDRRVFIRSPFQVSLIESDLDGWLEPLLLRIQTGDVPVAPLYIAPVPKGKALVRPGAWLPLHEHLAVTALIGAAYEPLYQTLHRPGPKFDFAYQMRPPSRTHWLRPRFECYDEFRKHSAAVAHKTSHVAFVDIAAYYENINLSYLSSQLRSAGVSPDVEGALMDMLRDWEVTPGLGLPQGLSASDILAKLYLDPVDLALNAEGFKFVRYVDDVRIFVDSESDAKRVLVRYIELLRERGLQVQSKKTRVAERQDALQEINRASPVIARINKKYTEAVIRAVGPADGDPYMPVFEVDQLVAEHPGEVSDDPITTEIAEQFASHGTQIDGSVLRFLFNRLAKLGSAYGWRDLLLLLGPRPEETGFILGHVASVGRANDAEPLLVEFMQSPGAVYEYQNFQILYWIAKRVSAPGPASIEVARGVVRSDAPWYLRMAARWLLAGPADQVDLDHMEEQHRRGLDLLREDVDLLCCLEKMEKEPAKPTARARGPKRHDV